MSPREIDTIIAELGPITSRQVAEVCIEAGGSDALLIMVCVKWEAEQDVVPDGAVDDERGLRDVGNLALDYRGRAIDLRRHIYVNSEG